MTDMWDVCGDCQRGSVVEVVGIDGVSGEESLSNTKERGG